MANDFDPVSKIIEYWRFENNLTAGKNPGGSGVGHNLTASAGGVTYNDATPLEGTYSLSLAKASNQWASIPDADLLDGFPLKNGDANKKVSWGCWIKPTTVNQQGYLISKYDAGNNKRSLALAFVPNGALYIHWGYNNGLNREEWLSIFTLVAGQKYHIGLAADGIAKSTLVRVWDDTAGTASSYNKTWTNELNVEDAAFMIGNVGDALTTTDYDGLIDEVVVADAVLTAAEFDSIRQGTFNQANPATLNAALSMEAVNIAGDYIYQPFIVF